MIELFKASKCGIPAAAGHGDGDFAVFEHAGGAQFGVRGSLL